MDIFIRKAAEITLKLITSATLGNGRFLISQFLVLRILRNYLPVAEAALAGNVGSGQVVSGNAYSLSGE